MMTRKHFVYIAKILSKHNASRELIHDFEIMCISDNLNFDAEKFREAAGWEDAS